MKYKRIEAGHYQSEDGRIDIIRVKSQQTRRKTEVCWEAWVDGKSLVYCEYTKRDAIEYAEKYMGNKFYNPPGAKHE